MATIATNPVESLARAVYSALENKDILRNITRSWRGRPEEERPGVSDVFIWHFHQVWGSTALGFGGVGGAAMTGAYTTVIKNEVSVKDVEYAVFFAGRHAYTVENPNGKFLEDLKRNSIASLAEATKYD